VLTVTKVKMTTTIYDNDDTAMLNSDRRLRDRNCVTATVTATQLNCVSVISWRSY